jgi:Flp pilus assembly pilin Flp
MKKFFSKFLKDTRGVVMMEYIILGCFAVAITVAAVLALGKVYNNGLATMGWATLGATKTAVKQNTAAANFLYNDMGFASKYAADLAQNSDAMQENTVTFDVY